MTDEQIKKLIKDSKNVDTSALDYDDHYVQY